MSKNKFLHHAPCSNCGSRDNLGVYEDHTYCFGCQQYQGNNEDIPEIPKKFSNMIEGIYEAIPSRKLDSDTCQKFNYQTGNYKDKPCHIANFFDKDYNKVAQKLRFQDKSFLWLGDTDKITLFGQNLWRDGGKTVIITEGEIDCLSVSKVQNNRYPVVSVPSGASSAKKYIKQELEWLSKFENIVLMFDNDEAGTKASVECANILPVKKVKIARLPAKDPNELLQKGQATKLYDSIWEAKAYTPQGIVEGNQTKELLLKDDYVETIPYQWNGLNNKLGGIRQGELTLLCAGSGTGKSQVCRELAYHLISQKIKVGYIALEENVKRSIRGIVGLGLNKLIHKPDVRKQIPEEELIKEWNNVKDYICFYDSFGVSDTDDLMNRIRYMVVALDCKIIFLDHISIVVSSVSDGDERRNIDLLMTNLRKLVEEIKCSMFVVSHLKRPEGKLGHEEGVQTSLSHLRGSHSLAQLSDGVIGFERDQQDESSSNIMTARVLKNRYSGDTGIACSLTYNKDTGRLSEGDFDE